MLTKSPRPTVFLGPQGVYEHLLRQHFNLQKRKGTCDMAFIGGTFIVTPHTFSGTTRLQQWMQRRFYLQKARWASFLLTASRQAYTIHYHPDATVLDFLKKVVNLPIRFLYFWPLEAAQQILKKHPRVPWSFLWLPTPLGTVSLMVYHNDRPLFCRTLSADATLAPEIIPMQQYLKRFGYEKNTPLYIFIPASLTPPEKPSDPALTFIAYAPPVIIRPTAPLSVPDLARNHWLARLPLASQLILTTLIFLGSYGAGREAWQLRDLYQRQQQLQATLPPLHSVPEKILLDTIAPYGAFWKTASYTNPLTDYRFEISEALRGIVHPREMCWRYHPAEDTLILDFDENSLKAHKTTLTDTFKTLKSISAISWKTTQLHLRVIDHDSP